MMKVASASRAAVQVPGQTATRFCTYVLAAGANIVSEVVKANPYTRFSKDTLNTA